MLGRILAVTMQVPDLATIENAYKDLLGYVVVERGTVCAASGRIWGTPKAIGHNFLLLQPESGAEVYLRFIEINLDQDYKPLTTYGWNATEILVKDVDKLYEQLKESVFEIIAPPRNLSHTDLIRAMQVFGPARELLYLTTIKDPNTGLGQAESFVDRPFIVINGGMDMESLVYFYGTKLGIDISAPQLVRMSALNKLRGFDSETKHPLATANIGGPFMIELDQYPEGTKYRSVKTGHLPSGTAMVTFQVDSLETIPVSFVSNTGRVNNALYRGRAAGVIKGPSDELLELVETGTST